MTEDIEKFISEVTAKDSHELCREVMSITDTMDVLRSKWTGEVLTAIVCIQYWMTFLNGVAGREHSHEHAVNSAKIFNQCKPMLVGTGGLTLFPGTPLLEEAQRGEFTPLTERELMQELLTFLELLTCDCALNTHHTSSMNLTGSDFLKRKPQILEALRYGIEHFDMDELTSIRHNKRTL